MKIHFAFAIVCILPRMIDVDLENVISCLAGLLADTQRRNIISGIARSHRADKMQISVHRTAAISTCRRRTSHFISARHDASRLVALDTSTQGIEDGRRRPSTQGIEDGRRRPSTQGIEDGRRTGSTVGDETVGTLRKMQRPSRTLLWIEMRQEIIVYLALKAGWNGKNGAIARHHTFR